MPEPAKPGAIRIFVTDGHEIAREDPRRVVAPGPELQSKLNTI